MGRTRSYDIFNISATFSRTTFLILVFIFGFGGLHHRHQTAFLVLATAAAPSSARYYTIHWNSTNPIFRIDNTDNIIDVNRNNLKFEYDQVNLICPVYSPGTRDDEMEKYIIYNVSKEEYETCRITNPNPRIIAVCDKPYKLMYFTITFRPFTPQPGGLEFLPGHDYYFISTSTSDDLHRRIGGRCTTHNMKIVFKVWEEKSGSSSNFWSSPAPTQQSQKPIWWSVFASSSTQSTIGASATSPATNRNIHSPHLTTKKTNVFKKHPHPNEVVKSEELSLDGGGTNENGNKSGDKSSLGTRHQAVSWHILLLWHTVLTIFTVQFYAAYIR